MGNNTQSNKPQTETLNFEAEVKQLLHLVTNALYSNDEIFLRELISNASDAADKLRFEALNDDALFEGDSELKIWVDFDEKHKVITIRDNGIGMTREEAIANLGTIAKSGTKAFLERLSSDQAKDSRLIGQFGVGFYSAFVVADQVVVRTRRAGMVDNQGVQWSSDGSGQFTVENIDKPDRGTEIILHIKDDKKDFLSYYRIKSTITKYSDHIALPILMKKPEMENNAEEAATKEDGDNKTEVKKQAEYEVINRATALWTLPKAEISDEDYNALYKHIGHDYQDPLAWIHSRVEGNLEYINLLYLPSRAPFDLWNREGRRGVKLYVRRVFIMDDAEHFMPMYLRFVKGIIDSNDLPLNVSREILQNNAVIEKIRSGCTKKILGLLEDLAKNEPEKYSAFWKEFGQVLKEGPGEDFANRDRIAKLLRFSSTHTDQTEQNVSLDDYISRMPETQKKIYYIIADNFIAAKNNPLLEMFRSKKIEVLLMSDRVDEWLTSHLTEYQGKELKSIAKGELDLEGFEDEASKDEQKQAEKDFEGVIKEIQNCLKDQVQSVRVTHRLIDSPACVVFDADEMSGHLQRLMASAGQAAAPSKPILELNPKHPLVSQLKFEADTLQVEKWSRLLLGQALLAEGQPLENPAEFVKELNALLLKSAH